jgi:hypothetical protein
MKIKTVMRGLLPTPLNETGDGIQYTRESEFARNHTVYAIVIRSRALEWQLLFLLTNQA